VAWTRFVAKLYDHFETNTHHLGYLTNLKQTRQVEEFIASFEQLAFRTEGMIYAFFREFFINNLKDEIDAHFLMDFPQTWLEATKLDKEAQQFVSSQTQKPPFIPPSRTPLPTTHTTPLKIHKLTQVEMNECQLKVIWMICQLKVFFEAQV
jgi:hypothetical protein